LFCSGVGVQPHHPAVNLVEVQRAEEEQRQREVEAAERRALMEAQMAELESIERRRQQHGSTASWHSEK